jgi:hypothetical protein
LDIGMEKAGRPGGMRGTVIRRGIGKIWQSADKPFPPLKVVFKSHLLEAFKNSSGKVPQENERGGGCNLKAGRRPGVRGKRNEVQDSRFRTQGARV